MLEALGLTDSWGRECMLVVDLNRLYGKHGVRYEDERVVKMAEAEARAGVPLSGREMHDFFNVLSEIDRKWMADHPDDVEVPKMPYGRRKGKKGKTREGR